MQPAEHYRDDVQHHALRTLQVLREWLPIDRGVCSQVAREGRWHRPPRPRFFRRVGVVVREITTGYALPGKTMKMRVLRKGKDPAENAVCNGANGCRVAGSLRGTKTGLCVFKVPGRGETFVRVHGCAAGGWPQALPSLPLLPVPFFSFRRPLSLPE